GNHLGFLVALYFSLLARGLFDPGAAIAQEGKQIKLSKHIQGFMAAYEDMAKLYDDANPEPDPKVEAQAEAVAKKNGFASLDEYDDVSFNITMIMSGMDPQTKKFTEPPEQIKKEIASLKADKIVLLAKHHLGTMPASTSAFCDGATSNAKHRISSWENTDGRVEASSSIPRIWRRCHAGCLPRRPAS